jgi:curli production assembly/transport component CsgF
VNRISRTLIIAAGLALAASSASASSLVYTPVNPTFGGNPNNGPNLLAQAQAQGLGTQAGQNSPNLSGLNSALSNLGSGLGSGTTVNVNIPTIP